jgi:hypothetical protein
MRTSIVMEEHYKYTRCNHSTPLILNIPTNFIVFRSTLLTLLLSIFAWFPPRALFSCPRKQLPSTFCQADVCLNIFDLLGECVRIHFFKRSFVFTFVDETQVSPTVSRLIWLKNSSPFLWYRSKKSKPKVFYAFFAHPWPFLGIYILTTCDRLAQL